MKERSLLRLLSRIKLQLLLAVVLAVQPIAMAGTASAEPASTATVAGELLASCEYKNSTVNWSTTVSCPDTISIGTNAGNSFAGVLKFDLNGFAGTVLEANLELFVTDNYANEEGSPELTIHQYNGSWTEPATTSEAPADWPRSGVLHSRTFAVTDEGGKWVKFNIAPLVRDRIAQGEDELDLVLTGSWADDPGKRFFNFPSSGPSIPKLNIAYAASPVQLPIPHTRIAAGDGFTLALQDDGTVKAYGWIHDQKIELPDGLTGVQAVYASDECGYAIKASGSVVALGEGCTVPDELLDADDVVGLVLGGFASAALKKDGTVLSLGYYKIPDQWKNIHAPFKSISGGYNHAAALTWDNAVVSWGSGSMGATSVPDDLPETTAIASGLNHTLALLTDGTVRMWGPYFLEQVPEDLSDVVAVDANDNYSVALKRDGHVVVWGYGEQLQPPPGLDGVVAIAAGRSHLIALKSDGTLVGWGDNRHGETVNPAPSFGGLSWSPGSEIGTTAAKIAEGSLQDERYGDLILKYRIGNAGSVKQPYVGEDPSDLGYDTELQPDDELAVSPGQHIYVLAVYEEEGEQKIAYWSDITVLSSQVKQALVDNNNNNNSNSSGPSSGKEIIMVDVVIGGEQSADTAKVEIERTRQANGKISDLVTFHEAKANEVAQRAAAAKQNVARIVIPDVKDEVGEVRVNVPRNALAVLQKNKIDLEIHTDNAVIRVPIASLDGLDTDFYFRLVPVREAALRQEIEQRARKEQVVRKIAGNDAIQVVARPMTIETNLSSRAITLTLPLRDVVLPQDAQERAAYLKQMGIFIEHSDGEKEVVSGKAVTGANGKLGLQFDVNKFSTFTILHMNGSEQQSGTHSKYVNGYPDGTFGAERNITRAEMATLLVNSDIIPPSSDPAGTSFPDVAATYWAVPNINRAEKSGLLIGFPDGTFRADASITRAEMAAIAYRYLKPDSVPSRTFSDVPASHWASGMIATLSGYMDGYPDLTFRPNDKLTRAEAVTILNRLLKRGPLNGTVKQSWRDVDPSHWAYANIEEASTDHAYTLRPEGEEWLSE